MHLNDLAAKVKEGVQKAGLIGYRFNTIGVSDGISNGRYFSITLLRITLCYNFEV